eukprot:TRINITY_DN54055_c0_g1_i1.p1 TRINITY_DN54055_c0_g1~~TRINITY_DN54055_c0_g1_i1.p1  ORF type:complete len:136 (-),score=17.94 TRINITY_DN54055_c0_g1_i1:53-460(-)
MDDWETAADDDNWTMEPTKEPSTEKTVQEADDWDSSAAKPSLIQQAGVGSCAKSGVPHTKEMRIPNNVAGPCSVCIDKVAVKDGFQFTCCGKLYCHRCVDHTRIMNTLTFKPRDDTSAEFVRAQGFGGSVMIKKR